jgi:hypothetical protein
MRGSHVAVRTGLAILIIGLSACATPNMFETLKESGYIMSPNFSSAYEPGTLIQTARIDRDGKVTPFKTPVVITMAADCFPGKAPQQKDLVLPKSRGQRSVSLDFGANALTSMATSLNINMGVVKNYSLTFEKPQVIYYPISDIFGQLSPKCVQSLDAMQQAGNKIEWYEIIYEIVIAHSLSFKLEWNIGASVDARLAQANEVQQQVEDWVAAQPQYQAPGADPYGQYAPQPQYQAPAAGTYDPYAPQQQYAPGSQVQSPYQAPPGDPYGQYAPQPEYAPGPQVQSPYQTRSADPYGQYAPQQQRRPKPDIRFKMGAVTSNTTELRADGVVVVAYRSAALKPIKP